MFATSNFYKVRAAISSYFLHIAVILVVIVIAFPFFYMFSMALMTERESLAIPARLLPRDFQWQNLLIAWERIDAFRTYSNTLIVAIGGTLSMLLFSSLAGYAFAKFNFRWKNIIFAGLLGTMTIPVFINIIPWFWMVNKLDINNTLAGVVFPTLVSAFGIFLMRQFMQEVPDDLIDAARVDGASEPTIFVRIALPLMKPALATLGAFTFLAHWNDLLWPLITLSDRSKWTINLVVLSLQGYMGASRHMEIAGASLAVIPILIMVVVLQRYFIQSTVMSGMKG
jgi:multiple sugar transport system permease protein